MLLLKKITTIKIEVIVIIKRRKKEDHYIFIYITMFCLICICFLFCVEASRINGVVQLENVFDHGISKINERWIELLRNIQTFDISQSKLEFLPNNLNKLLLEKQFMLKSSYYFCSSKRLICSFPSRQFQLCLSSCSFRYISE